MQAVLMCRPQKWLKGELSPSQGTFVANQAGSQETKSLEKLQGQIPPARITFMFFGKVADEPGSKEQSAVFAVRFLTMRFPDYWKRSERFKKALSLMSG